MNDDVTCSKLERALQELGKDELFIPPQIDGKVRQAVEAHFAKTGRTIPIWHRWVAVAAVLTVLLTGLIFQFGRWKEAGSITVAGGRDINRDGVVDVLDAIVLGRGVPAEAGGDLNGDGRTDAEDAIELLRELVRLEGGGGL